MRCSKTVSYDHPRQILALPSSLQKKKNGDLRMCINYRAINSITKKNKYPLPLITECLDSLSGAKIFSSLDLKSAYNQIRIAPSHERYTTFRTKFGAFESFVLSFGLCSAPSTFQMFINDVLQPVLGSCAIAYLDDIIVFSKNEEEHRRHLKQVLLCFVKIICC